MKMRRALCGVGVVAMLGLGAGCAHDGSRAARQEGEKVGKAFAERAHFTDQLARLDQEQIALGRLALERTQDREVRLFAENLIRDHEQHLAQLRSMADEKAFSLSMFDLSADSATGGAGLDGAVEGMRKEEKKNDKRSDKQMRKFLERRDELASLSGRDFDRAFIDQVKSDQERGEELARDGLDEYRNDTRLALLLSRSAPIYHIHQQQAATLKGFIGD